MLGGDFYRVHSLFFLEKKGLAWTMGRLGIIALSIFLGFILFLLIPAGNESFPGSEAKGVSISAGNPPAPAKATAGQVDWSCLLNRFSLSGDWKSLAIAGPGATVWLLDLESGKAVGQVEFRPLEATCLALSPDGKMLGCANSNNEIKVIDIDYTNLLLPGRLPGRNTVLGRHDGPVTSLAFSPDGTTLLSSGIEKTVQLWDVRSGEHLNTCDVLP